MAGSYLGTGATHVVCHPQTAVKWLTMGKSFNCKSGWSIATMPNSSAWDIAAELWLSPVHGVSRASL